MEQPAIAPWAEVVPDAPYPMTVAEFARWPDRGWRYELVRGWLVQQPLSGGGQGLMAVALSTALLVEVKPRHLGYVLGADGGFQLDLPGDAHETVLVPRISFVNAGRAPAQRSPEWDQPWHLAPDLVVEMADPEQPGLGEKAQLWLAAGVRLVWIVTPLQEQVEVWRPGQLASVQTLGSGAQLDGLEVVPGFSYPVAGLFKL